MRFCLFWLAGSVLGLSGCIVGAASVGMGRGVYRDVINRTEDEQLLNMIVRDRYSDTYSMLAVAGVTATIRASANVRGDFGLSRSLSEDYVGNLVPLTVGATIEESPTISYVPIGGEKFVQQLLRPLSMEELLMMRQYLPEQRGAFLKVALSAVNGIPNPRVAAPSAKSAQFDRIVELWMELVHRGNLEVVQEGQSGFRAVFHVADESAEETTLELLKLAEVADRPANGWLTLPIRVGARGGSEEGLILQSRSVLDILRTAGACIEIPKSHLEAGVVEPTERPEDEFMRIRSRRTPPGGSMVAVPYRGWWYYVDDADPGSKRSFLFLRTLVGLRLFERGRSIETPALTIPVK